MYAPEESCRIAMKREGTVANEVGGIKIREGGEKNTCMTNWKM